MTKLHQVKSLLSKKCLQCGDSFISKRSTAKFCHPTCRKSYSRANVTASTVTSSCKGYLDTRCPDLKLTASKVGRCPECSKIHNRFTSYSNTVIGSQVLMVCKRAGSIETFPNIQAIIEYTKLIKQRSKSCSIDDGKAKREYAICHKVPVQNFLVMGFTNSKNLFIGRSDQNAKAGNVLHPDLLEDKSLYLNRSKLDPRYLIDGMTSKEILVLLYNRFGHDLLNHIVKENHPKRPKKSSALPCDLNKSGRDIASVLGASIFTHFGSDTETALKLFSTALIESHFIKSISGNGMSSTLSNRFLIGPWIIIQDLLQTGDMFTCKYLQFDYVPLKPTLEYWDYEMPSLPCSNSQPV